jgi:hypothetical protein
MSSFTLLKGTVYAIVFFLLMVWLAFSFIMVTQAAFDLQGSDDYFLGVSAKFFWTGFFYLFPALCVSIFLIAYKALWL